MKAPRIFILLLLLLAGTVFSDGVSNNNGQFDIFDPDFLAVCTGPEDFTMDQLGADASFALMLDSTVNTTQNFTSLIEELLPNLREDLRDVITESNQLYQEFGDQVLFAAVNKSVLSIKYLVKLGANINIRNKNEETLISKAVQYNNLNLIYYLIRDCEKDINSKCRSMALHDAVYYNKFDTLKIIISNSSNVMDFHSENGYVLLLKCIYNGNIRILKYLIKIGNISGSYIDSKVILNSNLLYFAISNYKIGILKYFIEILNANPNIKELHSNINLLHISCTQGNLAITKYLIEDLNFDYNCVDSNTNSSILFYAVNGGNLEMVKYLIEELNMNYNVSNLQGDTILHWSMHSKNYNLIKYLIEELNMNVNARTTIGFLPLDYALRTGDTEIVQYIFNKTNIINNDKIEMLQIAAGSGNFEIFNFLIDNLNITIDFNNTVESNGYTFLHFATRGCNIELVKYLTEELKVKLKLSKNRETILHTACNLNENINLIKYLINNLKLNPNAINCENENALFKFAFNRHYESIKYLVSLGVNVNNENEEGLTALHTLAELGDLKITKFLIENGADSNIVNEEGNTPLHIAAQYGNFNIFQYLILHGNASITLKNEENKTAFDIANINKIYDIIVWYNRYMKYLSDSDTTNFEEVITHSFLCYHFNEEKVCRFYYY